MLIFTLCHISKTYGQCPPIKKRVYANEEHTYHTPVFANVLGSGRSVDGELYTFSQLNILLAPLGLIQSRQYLEFTLGTSARDIAANTPLTLKLGLPTSLLGVLDNLKIQPFRDLKGNSHVPVGTPIILGNLVNLINGNGEVEITITPSDMYHGVYIDLSSALGIALNSKIYYAYIEEEDKSSSVDCNEAIEILSGVRAGLGLAIANATASISHPLNAIDKKDATSTSLRLGAQVLSIAYLRAVFKSPSVAGEAVDILMSNNGSVLNLGLLNNFKITPYLGTTALSSLDNSSNFLKLQLLSSGTTNTYRLQAIINEPFDRVEISFGGVANVNLSEININEIRRVIPPPSLLINDTDITNPSLTCAGNTVKLSIANPLDCTNYEWFEDALGSTPITVTSPGTTFTTPALYSNKTYYVRASRTNACNNSSELVPVNVTISSLPTISLGTTPEICEGIGSTQIYVTNKNDAELYSIIWNTEAVGAGLSNITQTQLPANNSIDINTTNVSFGTYNGIIKVVNSIGCENTTSIQIKILKTPPTPNLHLITNSSYTN